jgi:HEAT repeat protein
MSEHQSPTPGAASADANLKKSRLMGVVRAVAALVICGALLCWAAFVVWDSRHPALAAARRLHASSPTDRLTAVRTLSESGTTDSRTVISALTSALADTDSRVRTAAAESLGLITSFALRAPSRDNEIPAAASGLIRLLKDPESGVRIAAARALMTIATTPTGGGRPAPKSASEPPPPPIDSAQLAAAYNELLDDPEADARLVALQGLAALGSKLGDEPPPALIKALEDTNPANQAAAITGVARFPRGGDPVIPAVIRSLNENSPPEVRAAARQALNVVRPSSISAANVRLLVSAVKNPDPDVRYEIIVLLSRSEKNAREAIPAFIEALKEPTDTDRPVVSAGPVVGNPLTGPAYVAAQALGRVAPGTAAAGHAVAALTEVLQSGPPGRRPSAASALGQFGPEAAQAIPALAGMLGDTAESESSANEKTFADALGRIAPGTRSAQAAITALTAALKSKSAAKREATAKAIERFGPKAKDAIPQLRTLLSDPDPKVCSAAAAAIKSLETDRGK